MGKRGKEPGEPRAGALRGEMVGGHGEGDRNAMEERNGGGRLGEMCGPWNSGSPEHPWSQPGTWKVEPICVFESSPRGSGRTSFETRWAEKLLL